MYPITVSIASVTAVVIFAVVYAAIVSERIDRVVAAWFGAAALLISGILTWQEALSAIDFNTIGLLLGMMILVAILKPSGLFEQLALWMVALSRGRPFLLLPLLGLLTGIISAFLDNVTTVLLIAPLTIQVARLLRLPIFPFLFTEVFASNIGGTATLIGDPPNIMIGSSASLSFNAFLTNNGPIIFLILLVTLAITLFLFHDQLVLQKGADTQLLRKNAIDDRTLVVEGVVVLALVITGFVLHEKLHLMPAVVALAGATLLLLLHPRSAVSDVVHDVEWPTLLFFVGLFVVVGGLVKTGTIRALAQALLAFTGGAPAWTTMAVLFVSGIASAFVDNIPFVATMIPLIQALGQGEGASPQALEPLWWALSLGACLGGNGTLIGASANVVTAGLAAREGEVITFMRFTRFGFPLMMITLLLAALYLWLRYL
ncbi:MAG: ArsB/NhaD family transporter [Firmicutes bacterium]|nr:ArsB/NhaD family transporter [Bacillota bacterium]